MARLSRWRGGLLQGNRREADMTQGSFNMGYAVKTPERIDGYDPKLDTEWLVRMDPTRYQGQGRLFTDRREVDTDWSEKATIGDSIHTDSYYLDQDYGKYHVTSDQHGTSIGLRRLHRGDNGVGVGNYQGALGLITEGATDILHAYKGDPVDVNFLGIPARDPLDFENFEYFPVTEFTGSFGGGLPQTTLFTQFIMWMRYDKEGKIKDKPGVLARFRVYYQDTNQILYQSHTDYQWEKGQGIPARYGRIEEDLLNLLSVDVNRPVRVKVDFNQKVWVAGQMLPISTEPLIFFDSIANEVIVDTLHGGVSKGDLGNSEFSVADIHDEKYAHSLHLKDLQILTADDDEPILFTSRWDGQDEGQSEWAMVHLFNPIPKTLHLRSEEILTGDDGIPILFTN